MKEKIMEDIINLLRRLNYFEIIVDPDKFEEFIQSLTVDQFKNLIVTFNSKLRGLPAYEKGTIDNNFMTVGTAVSPANDIRDSILEKLLSAIKKLSINKDRAALTYYTLLNLHMFEDANGRTARLFYNLILGNTDFKKDIDWYTHNENDIRENRDNFEYCNGLADVSEINLLSGFQLLEELKKDGLILDERIENKAIQIYGREIYIPYEIRKQLTDYEIKNIVFLLKDNDGEYTVGGLTMLIMAMKKGQLEEWIKANEESTLMTQSAYPYSSLSISRSQRFIFLVDRKREFFDSWTLGDYRNLIATGNNIKERKLTYTIDMFLNSDSYISEDEKKQAIVIN